MCHDTLNNMRTVKLIHPGWLSAPNGANTVINSILGSNDFFKAHGLDISSLSFDTYSPRSFSQESMKTWRSTLRASLKRWLKSASRYSRLAAVLIMYITQLKPSKKYALDYIESNPNPDEIVFFHSLLPCYYYLKYRKQKQNTAVVLHTNGDNLKMERIYYPAIVKSSLYKKLEEMEAFVLDNADRINFVSKFSRDNFLQLHPNVDESKVFYIYNGIPDNDILTHKRSRADVIEMCCVASVSRRKGQHYIIDALKRFDESNRPAVHFTFVGEGSDRGGLESEVEKSGLRKFIDFVGVTQDVDGYLSKSNAYILVSEDEGLPMAIIEAMRSSLPIISTPVGGIPEMIDNGVNGVMINPTTDDVYELLSTIDQYDFEKMGANAYATFKSKFSLSQMLNGYVNLLSF